MKERYTPVSQLKRLRRAGSTLFLAVVLGLANAGCGSLVNTQTDAHPQTPTPNYQPQFHLTETPYNGDPVCQGETARLQDNHTFQMANGTTATFESNPKDSSSLTVQLTGFELDSQEKNIPLLPNKEITITLPGGKFHIPQQEGAFLLKDQSGIWTISPIGNCQENSDITHASAETSPTNPLGEPVQQGQLVPPARRIRIPIAFMPSA